MDGLLAAVSGASNLHLDCGRGVHQAWLSLYDKIDSNVIVLGNFLQPLATCAVIGGPLVLNDALNQCGA
jgi:hypothetical protein